METRIVEMIDSAVVALNQKIDQAIHRIIDVETSISILKRRVDKFSQHLNNTHSHKQDNITFED